MAALFFLTWQLRSLLLLFFGAVLIAVIFRSIARPIRRFTKAPDGLAVALAVLAVTGVLAGASWMFGSEVSAQVRTLTEALPDAWRVIERRISEWALAESVEDMLGSAIPSGSGVLSGLSRFVLSFGSGLADILVVMVGGIYLAAQPQLYRRGALQLFPPQRRELAGKAFDESGRALRLWLKGQLISMVIVGLLVGVGLWLIGVPSALALGLLAALLEFIPLVGPILAALPALLIALALGPQTALWVLGLYLIVQQIEGNILQPVVQQYAVDLPAVTLLFSAGFRHAVRCRRSCPCRTADRCVLCADKAAICQGSSGNSHRDSG
nr:AI-2E family transporter [Altererythrobacter sp. KTW20L]